MVLAACAEAGFSPQFAVETPDFLTAIQFVATGIGITLVPGLGLGTVPERVVVVPVVSPTRSGTSASR